MQEPHPIVVWLSKKNKSLPWLARQVGMSYSAIYRLVNEERGVSLRAGEKIAKFTGIPLSKIAERVPPRQVLKGRR